MEYFTSSESRQKRPFQSSAREGGTLYFAYGSNLHLTQMANRCPASIFKGKAVLPGYRWQINQRGVANVVESANESVEGLLYLVNPRDERALDRSEGVSKHFYHRHTHHVDYEPHERYSGLKSSRVAHLLSQQTTLQDPGDPGSSSPRAVPPGRASDNPGDSDIMPTDGGSGDPSLRRKVKALVYVSENYTTDGLIREEYILRMKKAASDAVALGVSKAFVDRYMAPFFTGDKTMPPPSGSAAAKPRSSESATAAAAAAAGGGGNNRTETSKTPHTVDLGALKQANRSPRGTSGLEFPAEMLDAITSTRSRSEHGTIYIVSIEEQDGATSAGTTTTTSSSSSSSSSGTRFRVAETTADLELANELAIQRFRDVCIAAFPEIVARGFAGCAQADGAGAWPCVFDWELDRGSHVRLGAAVPELRRQITIRVEPHKLLLASS